MSRPRIHPIAVALTAGVLSAGGAACGDGTGPGRGLGITGYSAHGFAHGTDPATGETLHCGFASWSLATGGPLVDTWTGTTRLTIVRSRESPSLRVTHDTVIAEQMVTLTLLETGEVRLASVGAFADTLVAALDTAYPGYAAGDWTCGPRHPLAPVHEGAVLAGEWRLSPEVPFE